MAYIRYELIASKRKGWLSSVNGTVELQEKIASELSAQVISEGILDSKASTSLLLSASVAESQTLLMF